MGAIQNVGIVAAHRCRGLGRALVLQALHGFRLAGLGRAFLEVTAENDPAVRLYHSLGFRRRKTLYKAVDVSVSSAEPQLS
jgi:ribosomal protein S18 acetylase RimI-like enzyme